MKNKNETFSIENSLCLKNPETTFDLLSWNKLKEANDQPIPQKSHQNEIIFFFKGGGTHVINNRKFEIKDNAIHFVACNHAHFVIRNQSLHACSLLLGNDFFKSRSDVYPGNFRNFFNHEFRILNLDFQTFRSLGGILRLMQEEYTKGPSHNTFAFIQELINALLVKLTMQLPEERPNRNISSDFKELIRRNNKQHLSVEQYADLMNITPNYLNRICKTETGKSAKQIINECMLKEIKILLNYSSQSIKEIANELNFNEYTYFCNYFKKQCGYTAKAYREAVSQKNLLSNGTVSLELKD